MVDNDQLSVRRRVAVITEHDGRRETLAAFVCKYGDDMLQVMFEDRPAEGVTNPVAVLIGAGPAQHFLRVREAVASEGSLTLFTDSNWSLVLDRRGAPRYPAFLSCELESEGSVVTGRCVDISMRGAAIETERWDARDFAVVLRSGAVHLKVRCVAVASEPMLGIAVIHAQFRPLPPESRRQLKAIVDAARDEFEAAQRYLALRADDPSSGTMRRMRASEPAVHASRA